MMTLPPLTPGPQPGLLNWLNWLRALGLAGRVIGDASSGIEAQETPEGTLLRINRPRPFWIKLTGGGAGGKYAWTMQRPSPSGGWEDDYASGTASADPAYEVGGNTSIPLTPTPPVVRAVRDPGTTRVLFQLGTCS